MKQRILYLDFLRCFAIFMVLILHSINGYIIQPELYGTVSWYINLFLNAFARSGVPMFFMISGCLMLSFDETRNFRDFYKKRLVHIGIPLVFWNVVYFVYKCVMGYIDFDITILLSDFINCGTEYHLWYLYTLIGIYLIAPFLKMLVDGCTMKQLFWLLFLMMFGTTIRPFINIVTPFYVYLFDPLFNGYLGCFVMGYVLSSINTNFKTVICFSVIGILGLAGSVVFNHIYSSNTEINLVFNYGYSLCHYALAASVFIVSKYMCKEKVLFRKSIAFVSKYTFGIYLVHVLVNDLISNRFMINLSPVNSSIYIFAMTFVISLLVSWILSKIKYVNRLFL